SVTAERADIAARVAALEQTSEARSAALGAVVEAAEELTRAFIDVMGNAGRAKQARTAALQARVQARTGKTASMSDGQRYGTADVRAATALRKLVRAVHAAELEDFRASLELPPPALPIASE